MRITVGNESQIREVRAGCNYLSQNPAECFFGTERASVVNLVEVFWPDGTKTEMRDVPTRRQLTITYQ